MTDENKVEEVEIDPVEVAEETFLGDLVTFVLDELKALPKAWPMLSESDQDIVLERLQRRAKSATRSCIDILASQARPVVQATVEQVTFKGGIKAVLQVPAHAQHRHELADAEGQEVMIVIKGAQRILKNQEGMPESDADQPELGLEEDVLFEEALATVKELERPTISNLQRSLKIGYNRAANLMDQLQTAGWVTEADENGVRHLTAGTTEQQEEAA